MVSRTMLSGFADAERLILPEKQARVVLGRSQQCDVVVPYPTISGRHAALLRIADGWIVRDLGSTNGTFVADVKVAADMRVKSGDIIGLGSYRLMVVEEGDGSHNAGWECRSGISLMGVAVDSGCTRLLEDVSLEASPGDLIGVMGASGAGKSTLLSAVVGEQKLSAGRVIIAGIDAQRQRERLRGQVGYVPQDDIMHSGLTVERALFYAARLRLPNDYLHADICARVSEVTTQLGLTGTETIRIGTPMEKGLSGGQRKRVNIAMEMMTDPPVLILDEPTSGLSSVDAIGLMQLMRRLADAGKIIILTIHQPSTEILKLLTAVAVLARDDSTTGTGRLVWFGPAYPEAAQFFEPPTAAMTTSPDAEAILRGLSSRSVAEWQRVYRRSTTYRDWVHARLRQVPAPPSALPQAAMQAPDIFHQAIILMRRMISVKIANRWNAVMLLLQAPVIAMLVVGAFGAKSRAELNEASWADVSRSVAMTSFLLGLAAVWFGCSNSAREIVDERAIFRRERFAGLSPLAYVTSKVFVLGMMSGLQCGVLWVAGVYGCGFSGDRLFMATTLAMAAATGMAIGLCVSAVATTTETAAAALPIVVLPLVVLGGVLVPLPDLSPTLAMIADLMPTRWTFEALLGNEAAARQLLQLPDRADPSEMNLVDIAEVWFPSRSHRSDRLVPLLMLAAMSLICVGNVWHSLIKRTR